MSYACTCVCYACASRRSKCRFCIQERVHNLCLAYLAEWHDPQLICFLQMSEFSMSLLIRERTLPAAQCRLSVTWTCCQSQSASKTGKCELRPEECQALLRDLAPDILADLTHLNTEMFQSVVFTVSPDCGHEGHICLLEPSSLSFTFIPAYEH